MESSCCLFHELRLLHCLSKSNRQRQSPRRYENHVRKETYITHLTAPERVQSMLTGLHGIDIITPGTSTVDHIRDLDTERLQDSSSSQTQRQINAFYMS